MSELTLKKKHPALIILKILLDGHPVEANGEEWHYQDGVFGVLRHVYNGEEGKPDVILGVEITMPAFVKWCERMPEETILQTVFNATLADQRKPR